MCVLDESKLPQKGQLGDGAETSLAEVLQVFLEV